MDDQGKHSVPSKEDTSQLHEVSQETLRKAASVTGKHSAVKNRKARVTEVPVITADQLPQQPEQGKTAYRGQASAAQGSRRGKPAKKKSALPLVVCLLIVVVVVAALVVVFVVQPGSSKGHVQEGQVITVEVAEGSTSAQIAKLLVDDGVIADETSFNNAVKEQDASDQLKAGTYRFTGGEDVNDIVAALISGKTGYTLTVPEGLTAKKISKLVAKNCEVSAKSFYKLTLKAKKYVDSYPFLKGVYNNSLEGYLFPDTYNVPYGSSADDIIRMMLDNFAAQIASVDMTYASSKNLTTYDVVILASMVEKESESSDDKADIACVFYNRLHAGMNLGSDVTTYYAVGKELTEDLTTEDLNSDSPYNTRNPNNKGLPAGPICNPGLESLQAAANPSKEDYLYFFYTEKKGTMFFNDSASFDAAWAKYGN